MYPPLAAILSRLLVDRGGGHRKAVLAEAESKRAFDVLSDDERAAVSNKRLARLLNDARQHVPHWRDLIDDAVGEASARVCLSRLPVMTRAEIQSDPDRYVAQTDQPRWDDATGGSTGTPMVFKVDRATQVARESSLMWADSLCGWKYGERIAMLWGSDRDVQSATGRFRYALRWLVENRRWYNAFQMGPDDMRSYHTAMSKFRPHIVVAYAGAVAEFAQFLEGENAKPAYPLKGIVTSAELLTEGMRQQIENVFPARVHNRYGNREAGAIAAECSAHNGLHVNEYDFIVEVNSEDPFSIPGPIRITYLANKTMPFIRYETGDMGVLQRSESCSCGRKTLRLASIVGRESDMIHTPSGTMIHGEFFTHIFYGSKGLKDFRFIQETETSYVLQLVAEQATVREQLPEWDRQILEAVGAGCSLSVEFLESLPVLPSGKRRFTISHVQTKHN